MCSGYVFERYRICNRYAGDDSSRKDFPLQDYSILIIDDEMDIRSFIKTSFSGVFKQIYSADDGVNGLHVVHQCQPDLVICDIMMPHMDGFEFCRLLKSDIQISHIPVILLTARDNPDSLAAGYKLGADFYLAKPFDDDVLLTVIRNLLWNREQIKTIIAMPYRFLSCLKTRHSVMLTNNFC